LQNLPSLSKPPTPYVERYLQQIFADHFVAVEEREDQLYRAIFTLNYFQRDDAPSEASPTKSQWNTLKKRMKRVNHGVFTSREHGIQDEDTGYVVFGFLRDPR